MESGRRGVSSSRVHVLSRVLVAEDDVEMRRLVADTLREDGHEVVELADGGRFLVDIAARMKSGEDGSDLGRPHRLRHPHARLHRAPDLLEVLRLEAHWRTPVILGEPPSATTRRAGQA